mgnify:CR=1
MHSTYFCNLSILSILLFSRTNISSLESILTDATRTRMIRSSSQIVVKPHFPVLADKTRTLQPLWLQGLCGAAGRIRTADLILTK